MTEFLIMWYLTCFLTSFVIGFANAAKGNPLGLRLWGLFKADK
jgi:hypothetical protein